MISVEGNVMVRILEKNLKKGYIKLIPENTDDLWLLYNIIRKGDVVIAKTTRDVKVEGKSRRIPMVLAIKVTHLEFQPFTTRLRIRGIVVDGPEQFGVKGHYHTINLEAGKTLTIVKEEWPTYMISKLEKALSTRGNTLLIAIDYDEYAIGLLGNQGLMVLVEGSSRIPGKKLLEESMIEKYKRDVAEIALSYVNKYTIHAIIIGSPGHLKYDIKDIIEQKVSKDIIIHVDNISVGGLSGLYELSRRDKVVRIMNEVEAIKAFEVINEFMRRLAKEHDKIAYGLDEVEIAIKNNAVEKIVVAESLIRSGIEEILKKIDEMLNEADKKKAEIIIAPCNSEAEKRILGLGGIIALLRYPLPIFRRREYSRENAST